MYVERNSHLDLPSLNFPVRKIIDGGLLVETQAIIYLEANSLVTRLDPRLGI